MPTSKPATATLLSLGDAQSKKLFKHASQRKLPKGDSIWHAGDDPEAVWMVKEGRASMVIEGSEGASAVVHFCTTAETFCPAAAISGRPYPCSAVAATDMVLVSAPRSSFMKLLNNLPEFARKLINQMASQVCDSHCRQAQSTAPVKSRLASLLGNLHRRYDGHDLPFTRQDLANMSGTTVESAIRTLSQWEKNGVIESGRGSIHVKQPETLAEAAA